MNNGVANTDPDGGGWPAWRPWSRADTRRLSLGSQPSPRSGTKPRYGFRDLASARSFAVCPATRASFFALDHFLTCASRRRASA